MNIGDSRTPVRLVVGAHDEYYGVTTMGRGRLRSAFRSGRPRLWNVVGLLGVILVVLEVISIKRFLKRRKDDSSRMLAQSSERE